MLDYNWEVSVRPDDTSIIYGMVEIWKEMYLPATPEMRKEMVEHAIKGMRDALYEELDNLVAKNA